MVIEILYREEVDKPNAVVNKNGCLKGICFKFRCRMIGISGPYYGARKLNFEGNQNVRFFIIEHIL